jgi:hypothetical protein
MAVQGICSVVSNSVPCDFDLLLSFENYSIMSFSKTLLSVFFVILTSGEGASASETVRPLRHPKDHGGVDITPTGTSLQPHKSCPHIFIP